MLDQAAAPATSDDAVRGMLRARIDDAYRLATRLHATLQHLRAALDAEDAVQEAALF